ncbi:hypothetical protein LINPERPRIM_LOCUS8820 [Linum perenne]
MLRFITFSMKRITLQIIWPIWTMSLLLVLMLFPVQIQLFCTG